MAKKPIKRRPRKKTKEAEYEVDVQNTSPGASVTSSSTSVDASSTEDAIRTATRGRPTKNGEEITVRKVDPRNKPMSKGVVEGAKPIKTITESVKYPYSFTIPKTFSGFLEEMDMEYKQVGHSVMVEVANKTQLAETLRKMNKSDDPKAGIIMLGISRSVS